MTNKNYEKKLRILLVIPRYSPTNKINYEYLFPLGLAYISSVIKREGYNIDCINLNHFDGSIKSVLNKKLDSVNYDIVATGHITTCFNIVEEILNVTKDHISKPKTILGGAIITSEPKLMFETLKPDFAVIGEGEKTIIELLDSIENKKDFSKVDGIMYWKDEKIIFTKPREQIKNLDSLIYPDFEILEFEKQLENMSFNSASYGVFDEPRVYPIIGSRGCPFQCTFCYHSLGSGFRMRSVDNIINELRLVIKKYKINVITLYDEVLSVNKERLYEFCRKIKKLFKEVPWKCKWNCQLTVHNVDKQMLQTMKNAGCYGISYGFESYSPIVLKSMKKPITPEQIDNAIKLTMEAGISIQGNFIFGDIAETKETAKETLDYWEKNCKGQIHLGFIMACPNSEDYQYCIKKGIIKDRLDFIKNHMSQEILNMTNMTEEEFSHIKERVIKGRIKYVKNVIPNNLRKDKEKNINQRYTFSIKCPFCKEEIVYKNFFLSNRFLFSELISCKKCRMRFRLVSLFYMLGFKNYSKIKSLVNKIKISK